jgi:hypothetical protein
MKKIDVGQTIGVLANVGVILGIVFLSLQLNQANRIATNDARRDVTERTYNLEMSILQSPELVELLVKLKDPASVLTPEEEVRAGSYARVIMNMAATVGLSFEDGFLTDEGIRRNMRVQSAFLRRTPGIAPYLAQSLAEGGPPREFARTSLVWESLYKEVEQINAER